MTGKVAAPQQTYLQGKPVAIPTNFEKGNVTLPAQDTLKKQSTEVIKGDVKCINPPKKQEPKQKEVPVMGMVVPAKPEKKQK